MGTKFRAIKMLNTWYCLNCQDPADIKDLKIKASLFLHIIFLVLHLLHLMMQLLTNITLVYRIIVARLSGI